MRTEWALQTAPTLEPITVGEASEHLRLDGAEDYLLVQRMIKAARSTAEQFLKRGLLTQTWKYAQDDWTDEIMLPMAAPLASVTSVSYYNTSGTLTVLGASNYTVETLGTPGRVRRAPDVVWPELQSDRRLRVEIIYVVGWTTAAAVPVGIVDGIYQILAGSYDEDGALSPSALAKLTPYRVWWSEPCA